MANRKHLIALTLVGVLAAGAAWGFRQYLFSTRYRTQIALQSPVVQQITAQIEGQEAAVKANPKDVRARWRLADMYQKINMLDKSAEQLRAIDKLEPGKPEAIVALADVALATIPSPKAEFAYRDALKRFPKSAPALQGLATTLYHQRRFAESMQASSQAVAIQPASPSNRFLLASACLQYAAQFPDPNSYGGFALRAKVELEKILPVWPQPAEIHFRLGSACEMLRDNKGAIEHFLQARQGLQSRPDVHAELARAYIMTGDRASALKVVRAALDKGVENGDLHDLHSQLILFAKEPNANERAVEESAKAVKLSPRHASFWERYGGALVRVNKMEEARKAFEEAVILNPERAYGYQQLAAIYTRMGDTQRANAAAKMASQMVANDNQLRQIQLLSQVHPENMNLQIALADRYRQLGLKSAAWDKYIMVRKMDPGNKKAEAGLTAMRKERETAVASSK